MAFVPSKAKKNPPKGGDMPNLNSMMDMMTIILLFLLKSLASAGAIMPVAPGIELPESSAQTQPQQHLSFIINSEGIFEGIESKIGVNLATAGELTNPELPLLGRLIVYLDSAKAVDKKLGRTERAIITLQGDRNTSYSYLYKFISSCGEAGFSTIQFIVTKR